MAARSDPMVIDQTDNDTKWPALVFLRAMRGLELHRWYRYQFWLFQLLSSDEVVASARAWLRRRRLAFGRRGFGSGVRDRATILKGRAGCVDRLDAMTAFDARPEAEGRRLGAYPGPPLSRSGRLALYRQIADRLRQLIATGVTRLPTERRLAEDFAVSRVTVRLALALLAADRLISRRPRFGTRVMASGAGSKEGASQPLKTERASMVSIPVDRS